jgi:hypothetical protein
MHRLGSIPSMRRTSPDRRCRISSTREPPLPPLFGESCRRPHFSSPLQCQRRPSLPLMCRGLVKAVVDHRAASFHQEVTATSVRSASPSSLHSGVPPPYPPCSVSAPRRHEPPCEDVLVFPSLFSPRQPRHGSTLRVHYRHRAHPVRALATSRCVLVGRPHHAQAEASSTACCCRRQAAHLFWLGLEWAACHCELGHVTTFGPMVRDSI